MTTMNISLPDTLKSFVDTQLRERGYGSSSEYIRDLIRNDQIQQAERRLAALMLEGINSGPAMPIDQNFWDAKHENLKSRLLNKEG
ncbi:MAG: type II toxin-antitoxin system ParD family antitoxin [Candidatus Methylumidiphilus sp.]